MRSSLTGASGRDRAERRAPARGARTVGTATGDDDRQPDVTPDASPRVRAGIAAVLGRPAREFGDRARESVGAFR